MVSATGRYYFKEAANSKRVNRISSRSRFLIKQKRRRKVKKEKERDSNKEKVINYVETGFQALSSIINLDIFNSIHQKKKRD